MLTLVSRFQVKTNLLEVVQEKDVLFLPEIMEVEKGTSKTSFPTIGPISTSMNIWEEG